MTDENVQRALESARLQVQQGHFPEAITDCGKAIEADSHCYDAWMMLGSLHQRAGDVQRANSCYRSAAEVKPDNPEIYLQLARTCSLLGNHKEAIEFANSALKCAPDNAKYKLLQADVLERRGDFEQCFFILKPFLEADKPHPIAVSVFSKICLILDLREECLTLLDRMLENGQLPEDATKWVLETKEWVSKANITGDVLDK